MIIAHSARMCCTPTHRRRARQGGRATERHKRGRGFEIARMRLLNSASTMTLPVRSQERQSCLCRNVNRACDVTFIVLYRNANRACIVATSVLCGNPPIAQIPSGQGTAECRSRKFRLDSQQQHAVCRNSPWTADGIPPLTEIPLGQGAATKWVFIFLLLRLRAVPQCLWLLSRSQSSAQYNPHCPWRSRPRRPR